MFVLLHTDKYVHGHSSQHLHTQPFSLLCVECPIFLPDHICCEPTRKSRGAIQTEQRLLGFGLYPLQIARLVQAATLTTPFPALDCAGSLCSLTFLYLWGKVNLSMVFCTAPRVTFPNLSSSCSSSCRKGNTNVCSTGTDRHKHTRE